MTPVSPKEINIVHGRGWCRIPRCEGQIRGTVVGKVLVRSAEHFWAASLGNQHCQSIVFLKMLKKLRYGQQMAAPCHGMWGVGVTVSVYTLTHTPKILWPSSPWVRTWSVRADRDSHS